jgi:signal transduction histidine kinase
MLMTNPILSTTSEGVLILNDQGFIIARSPHTHDFFDYLKNELVGLYIEKIIPGLLFAVEQHQFCGELEHRVVSEKKILEIKGVKKEGNELSLQLSVCQFKAGNETFTVVFIHEAFSGSLHDKKPTESNSLPAIFLILDNLVKILFINKYGCTLLGHPEEALRDLNWLENFLPADSVLAAQAILDGTNRNGLAEEYESPMLNLRGDRYTMRWNTTVIYNASGLAIGTLSTGIDSGKKVDRENDLQHIERIKRLNEQLELSARKQNQKLIDSLTQVETINKDLQIQIQKRKETEQKLIKIQRLYDTVIHNFPDGVIGVLNRDMEYVLIDGKDLKDIELPELGLKGQRALENVYPIFSEDTVSKIKKAFLGEDVSFEVKTANRFYTITAVPLADEHNTINEILCVFKNVTVRKQLEDGLLKALEKEKNLGELKSRFVTMACHEFKTPLATILSSAFLLENYSAEKYEKEKQLHTNRIKRSVNNLTMVLNEFLALETSEGNDVLIQPNTIHIPAYIKELIAEADPVKKQNQVIDYQHSGVEETVYLDPHPLWSIITNLLSNALKYSKQGNNIFVHSGIENNVLTIVVKDQGIGIPVDEQKYVFEQFYRAGNAMNYNGTGLGLLIVQKNIKLLNGSIGFTSQEGIGTEFTVTIPTPAT